MTKRILLNQIQPYSMKERHDVLAAEMLRRGYAHKSPYEQPDVSYLPDKKIDKAAARRELTQRCEECRKNFSR